MPVSGRIAAGVLVSLLIVGCHEPSPPSPPRELSPGDNPFGPGEPLWSPQPHRDRPSAIVASADQRTLFVALTGTEDAPGREIAIVDAETLETRTRVRVGPRPFGLALHPAGRWLVVTLQLARYAVVVDVERARVVREVETPYYTERLAFSPDGKTLYLANRWKDSILRWQVAASENDIDVIPLDLPRFPESPAGISVPDNPSRVLVSADGQGLLVASETALSLDRLDLLSGEVTASHQPGSPILDVALVGEHVLALHTGGGTQHPPNDGVDGDGDGLPGDGTANVQFQDVQNEIDVLSYPDLRLLHRYTSDTICCRDYRDVDPDRPESGLDLPPVDRWTPDRARYLPPRDTWIVAGALPERVVPFVRPEGGFAIAVVFQGSSNVQTFDVDAATGALSPRETAEAGLHRTGFGPVDAVVVGDNRLIVVDRLGESLTAIELNDPPSDDPASVVVGDVSGGAFPATDAELGEAFNFMTALFTVDGDQTCAHCHRDGTPIGKAVSMPLLEQPQWGTRLVLSYRGAFDSRPWFVEGAMDETNFFAVINEMARRENFCCEQTDTRIWSRYPTHEACSDDPSMAGCIHVLDCERSPPPECAERSYGSRHSTRDRHFRDAALRTFGRETTFGDAIYRERVGPDGSLRREPLPLSFDGITRSLGVFLLSRPRLLPNPNAAIFTAAARMGERIYRSDEAGCAVCHPLGVTATAMPTRSTRAEGPLSFPSLVTPNRHPATSDDTDRVTPGFLGTFPAARQTDSGLRMAVLQLRGAWDRSLFLHHGRARSIREVVATPGHPGLRPGERGANERDGQPNTHGGTSHLSAEELDALVEFVRTL